ncbi:MAG: peptide-methionine (S)-S-oxide reductase MsrA [Gemmatimonadaceae bacterium]
MFRSIVPVSLALIVGAAAITVGNRGHATAAVVVPAPESASALAAAPTVDTAVFAGGCFWGIEAVFEHIKGVQSAVSGYAGGTTTSPSYEDVSSGTTGHAESVQVVYDPSVVSYGQLLQVFFSVAHDPTELNRQGPDHGTQYRSAIFYRTKAQETAAEGYVKQLTAAKTFSKPIVTQIVPLSAFYRAEDYHQDYMAHHPTQPYIVYNDAPKVEQLKEHFPQLYR